MKMRNLFHMTLAIFLAIPLFWGCLTVPEGPDDSNGYLCECTVETDNAVSMHRVVKSSDDAEEGSGGAVNLNDVELNFSNNGSFTAVRFSRTNEEGQDIGLGIPRMSTINGATVSFIARGDRQTANTRIEIFAEDFPQPANPDDPPPPVDTFFPATFESINNDISQRVDTTNDDILRVTWVLRSPNDDWEKNEAISTPDLQSLVKKVVNDPRWHEGRALVLIFKTIGNGDRRTKSFDSTNKNPNPAPLLTVDFSPSVHVQLPVCMPKDDEGNTIVVPRDHNHKSTLERDCQDRVLPTVEAMLEEESCNFFDVDADPRISCQLVSNHEDTPDDFGFRHPSCFANCTPTVLEPMCQNFDSQGYNECRERAFAQCGGDTSNCDTSECNDFVSATNTADTDPVCISDELGMPGKGVPFSIRMLGHDSTCEVAGLTQLALEDGRTPKEDPLTLGTLNIKGGPCPGETCPVGFTSHLSMGDVEFSVAWVSDPKFTGLGAYGIAEFGAVVGDQNTDAVGEAVNVARGRRRGSNKTATASNVNGNTGLEIGVNWMNRTCQLHGDLFAPVDAEGNFGSCKIASEIPCVANAECDEAAGGEGQGVCIPSEESDDTTLSVEVDLQGNLINQPPIAVAGADQTLECTSPDGAEFILDGQGSSDPDDNGLGNDIRLVSWLQGDRLGPKISDQLTVPPMTLGVGETQDYVLRVIDVGFQADVDTTTVSVVDTTAPTIDALKTFPNLLWPPNHRMVPVDVEVEASDICDAFHTCKIIEVASNEPINGPGDGNTEPEDWDITGDLTVKLRAERSGMGTGRVYTITVECTDASGNSATSPVTVTVPHDQAKKP